MPLPPQPCLECPNPATRRGRCDDHHRAKRRKIDQQRPNSYERGHTPAWSAFRKRYLAEHPWCVCQAPDCHGPSAASRTPTTSTTSTAPDAPDHGPSTRPTFRPSVRAATHERQCGTTAGSTDDPDTHRQPTERRDINLRKGSPRVYNVEINSGAGTVDLADLVPTVAEEQFVYAAQDHTHLGTYAGERRLWLPDSSANYASCPDAAALDITGDIDMRFWGAANDWLPGTTFYLLAKIDSLGGNWAYQFRVRGADGQLQATFSPDGTGGSAVVATCNGEASTVDGEEIALRVTWRVSDGRTQFFESLDDGKTWTQVGSDVTAAAGSIFSGSAPLQVGATNDGSAGLFAGVVKRAEVYDGIDGTLVAALDCNVPTHPRFRDGVGNSWTFNGSAYSWAEPA